MKEIARICISDSGKEVFVYSDGGHYLKKITSSVDYEKIAAAVIEELDSELQSRHERGEN